MTVDSADESFIRCIPFFILKVPDFDISIFTKLYGVVYIVQHLFNAAATSTVPSFTGSLSTFLRTRSWLGMCRLSQLALNSLSWATNMQDDHLTHHQAK